MSRKAVYIVKSRHKCLHTSIYTGFVRRQINLGKCRVRHVNGCIITSSLWCSVGCKVLSTSQNRIRLPQVPLKTLYTLLCYYATKIGIFTRTFNHSTPSRVSCYIHHWRKCPVNTRGRSFDRCSFCSFIHQI